MRYHLLFLTVALLITVLMSIESTPIDKTEIKRQPNSGGNQSPQDRDCDTCGFGENCCDPCFCTKGYCACPCTNGVCNS
uniref:Gsp_18 putative toxin n=1 Tax=Gemmula speciosa TaxID=439592 RepID=A0A098LXU2_GEMSP